MGDGNPLPNRRRWSLAVLAAITFAGLALRLTNAFESLWLDELHTGWVVNDAWGEVAWRAKIGNHSPLWFYAVKGITTICGESELILRLLSLAAGTALIPVAYWLVVMFAKTQAEGDDASFRGRAYSALLAPALVAVDPNCIFYATEARPYACLQLVAAIQLGLFWQILHEPTTRRRLAWIAVTTLAFYLHYTGILILAGELIALLAYYVLARRTVPYRPWRALFDWQLAVMLCLPALPHVLEVARRRQMWESMSQRPAIADLWHLFPLEALVALAVLYALWAIAMRWDKDRLSLPRADWKAATLVLVWVFIPVLLAFSAARTDLARLLLPRYLIALAIGPMLTTSLIVNLFSKPWLQALAAVAVFLFTVYDGRILQQLRYDGRAVGDRDEDWRGAIAWLKEQNTNPQWPVHVQAGLVEERDRLDRGNLSDDAWQSALARRRAYLSFPLFSLYDAGATPQQVLPQAMYGQLREKRELPNANPPGLWFVVRSPSPALPKLKVYYLAAKPQSFGNVHIGRYRRQSPPAR